MHTKAMHGTSSVRYLIRFRSANLERQHMALAQWHGSSQENTHTQTKAMHGTSSVALFLTEGSSQESTHTQRQCMALAQWHCFSQKAQAKKTHMQKKCMTLAQWRGIQFSYSTDVSQVCYYDSIYFQLRYNHPIMICLLGCTIFEYRHKDRS